MHVAGKAINGVANVTSTTKSDRLDIGFPTMVSYQVCEWRYASHLINLPMGKTNGTGMFCGKATNLETIWKVDPTP